MARLATVIGGAVIAVMTCMVQDANAEGQQVVIRFSQRVEVPKWIMAEAQNIVSDIYARAAVEILWADSAHAGIAALPIIVILATESPDRSSQTRDVLGVAIAPERGCGRVAYVLWPRIQAFARAKRIDVTKVLGRVLAHEVGHLLLGQNAHSPEGIMRANWNKGDFVGIDDRAGFTSDQSALLHQRIADELQAAVAAPSGSE